MTTDPIFSHLPESARGSDPSCEKLSLESASQPSSSSSVTTGTDSEPRMEGAVVAVAPCASIVSDEQLQLQHHVLEAQRAVILTSLSNQLEYYFSQQNLDKDTYLCTIRSLNDGCVPVSMLASFQKVNSILPHIPESIRTALIVQAASDFSDSLRVVYVDGQTSRLIEQDEIQQQHPTASMILSICTMDKQPLPTAPTASTSGLEDQRNSSTVVLRDVPESVTEGDVRGLFAELLDSASSHCPAIISVHLDVACCWFVVLDTESSEITIKVVEELQKRTLGNQPVHARRKASVASTVAIDPAPLWMAPLPAKKKKKKVRSKKKKKKKPSSDTAASSDVAAANTKTSSTQTTVNGTSSPPPPTMGEDNFPTLQDKQVEWETPPELDDSDKDSTKNDEDSEDNRKSFKNMSDVASTATTTSSSTESTPHGKNKANWGVTGGYAAALMKQVIPPAVNEHTPVSEISDSSTIVEGLQALDVDGKVPAPVVNVPQATWGSTSSFATLLRNEEELLRKPASS